jgi:hypothetical protein
VRVEDALCFERASSEELCLRRSQIASHISQIVLAQRAPWCAQRGSPHRAGLIPLPLTDGEEARTSFATIGLVFLLPSSFLFCGLGGSRGCLRGLGACVSAGVEPQRPAFRRSWRMFAVPFRLRFERNKLRCEARRDVPAASKTLALAKEARFPTPHLSCFSSSAPRTMFILWP